MSLREVPSQKGLGGNYWANFFVLVHLKSLLAGRSALHRLSVPTPASLEAKKVRLNVPELKSACTNFENTIILKRTIRKGLSR